MIVKLVLLCMLVNYCRSEDLIDEIKIKDESPLIKVISSIEKPGMSKLSELIKATSIKEMIMPEISRVICGCDSSKLEKCKSAASPIEKLEKIIEEKMDEKKKDEISKKEIEEITEKLEKILHKRVFKNIVKRSIKDDDKEEDDDAKEIDEQIKAKHIKEIFETIKKIFRLGEDKEVKEFHTKLMSLPEAKIPLNMLVKSVKTVESKINGISTSSIEITDKKLSGECKQESIIECGFGSKLKIIRASISNKNKYSCPASSAESSEDIKVCTEEIETTRILTEACDGKEKCTISVDEDFPSICECSTQRYLNMTYTCSHTEESRAALLSRAKRTTHYRNKRPQEIRDREMRRFAGYDYYYNYPFYDYYYGGFPFYDYYYGGGFGFPFYDYYYGGFPFYPFYDYLYPDYFYDYLNPVVVDPFIVDPIDVIPVDDVIVDPGLDGVDYQY